MTLDENSHAWELRRLRDYFADDHDPDAGSVEAEEAMLDRGAARRGKERRALAGNNESPPMRQDRDRSDLPDGIPPWRHEDQPTLDGAA